MSFTAAKTPYDWFPRYFAGPERSRLWRITSARIERKYFGHIWRLPTP